MTIITKPISEKKEAKPLDPEREAASAPAEDDLESQAGSDPSFIILRTRARRVSSVTTLCLLMTSLVVVGVGIIAGTHLYRTYLRSQIFKGWCAIPYEQAEPMYLQSTDNKDVDINQYIDEMTRALNNDIRNSFKEEFEIDTFNEDYEKITVPDFKDGRMGRFVHDFNTNMTGIIDISGKRCFVLPLDRNNTLQPRSMIDLIEKMWQGYYKVDTQVVREQYNVELPPVTNIATVGAYISSECQGVPIYRLKKLAQKVYKRSADLHHEAKFAHFSGKNVMEFDIMNFDILKDYEEKKIH